VLPSNPVFALVNKVVPYVGGAENPPAKPSDLYATLKDCKVYDLAGLTKVYKPMYPEPAAFKVPWTDKTVPRSIDIRAEFWDLDYGPNDKIVSFYKPLSFGPYENFVKYFPEGTEKCFTEEDITEDGRGILEVCISLEENLIK
jgi:hypothetical protein